MIIGLEGFGSVWSTRRRSTAFYNTTGIVTDGKLRHRSRIFGQLRFNEIGGFNPKHIERNIGRVFEASGSLDPSSSCILLHHLLSRPVLPDYYLFAVTSDRTGELQIYHSACVGGFASWVVERRAERRRRNRLGARTVSHLQLESVASTAGE